MGWSGEARRTVSGTATRDLVAPIRGLLATSRTSAARPNNSQKVPSLGDRSPASISWYSRMLRPPRACATRVRSAHHRRGAAKSSLSTEIPAPPLGVSDHPMKRQREMKRERDELDWLAAEAGHSADLVGVTALILVMALVLGFIV